MFYGQQLSCYPSNTLSIKKLLRSVLKQAVPAEPARLEFDHITVAYNGRPVLDDVTFDVPHGAQVAVVGPNGAGKSTLFKALVGLLPLRSGQIRIHSRPLGTHQDCVAYIPQREEVDWRFPVTVWDVVMMGRFGKFGWFGQANPRRSRSIYPGAGHDGHFRPGTALDR